MSNDPRTVTMNDELAKAITGAVSQEDIKAAILAEADKQFGAADAAAAQKAVDDKAAADKAAAEKTAADAATATSRFTSTEVIGGRSFTFEADTESELNQMVANAFRVAYAVKEDEPAQAAQTVDAAAAQKAAEEQAAAKADLELKFKRGEISAADYIEQSGAVDEYLAKKGIPIESLKATVEQNQATQFEKSWAQATEEFKNSPAGADWPGGAQNLELIGMKLAAMNLVDAQDKVAALARAYEDMKKTGMVFPATARPTTTAVATTAAATVTETAQPAATTVAATATPVPAKTGSTSSSLFGQSSGVSGAHTAVATTPAKVDIDPNASPAEMVDAWKKAQVAAGKDPNAAFVETFAARRA